MSGLIRAWRTVDKTTWGEGPWQREPDKVQWTDEATGLPCLAVRNASPDGQGGHGGWCGYVGVAEGHPWFGVRYSACERGGCGNDWCEHRPERVIDVHGGLTFSGFCAHNEDPSRGICHVPEPGQPDRVWWLGFDCAHSLDYSPGMSARLPAHLRGGPDEQYRTLRYVKAECRKLARQLAAQQEEEA